MSAHSLFPRATYLFMAHLRRAGGLTLAFCQQKEKHSSSNWLQDPGEGKAKRAMKPMGERSVGWSDNKDGSGM